MEGGDPQLGEHDGLPLPSPDGEGGGEVELGRGVVGGQDGEAAAFRRAQQRREAGSCGGGAEVVEGRDFELHGGDDRVAVGGSGPGLGAGTVGASEGGTHKLRGLREPEVGALERRGGLRDAAEAVADAAVGAGGGGAGGGFMELILEGLLVLMLLLALLRLPPRALRRPLPPQRLLRLRELDRVSGTGGGGGRGPRGVVAPLA